MKPSIALAGSQEVVRQAVRRFCTENPRVFGSVLHGTDSDGSDLDILVDAQSSATLFDVFGLQLELEKLLGGPVYVVTPADLPLKIRAQVLAEARPI